MKKPLEKSIEKRFLRKLRERWPTSKTRKMNGYGNRSWPDRLIVLPKTPIFLIEFKRPGGALSPGQENEIKELNALGVVTYVCDDAEQAIILCEMEISNAETNRALIRKNFKEMK